MLVAATLVALLAGQAHAHNQPSGGNPFSKWLGTYWGYCIQYAYQDSSGSYYCSDYPVTYPFYVTIGKYYDDSSHSWQYKYTWSQDETSITHDGASPNTYGVQSASYDQLPLYLDWYKWGSYCVHTTDPNSGEYSYFTINIQKDWGVYVYKEIGYSYFDTYNNMNSYCPKSNSFSLYCDESSGYYGYQCEAWWYSSSYRKVK